MKKTVVLYPGLGVGHLTPMVQLAKVFVQHGVAVIVALVEPPFKSDDFSAVVARATASNPSVTFHVLPPPPPPSSPADSTSSDVIAKMFHFLTAMNAPLRDFLGSLPSVNALVLDMFCGDAFDVAAELKLPAYTSYASGAGDLAVFLNLPSLRASMSTSFAELGDSVLSFPGAPPLKASDLPLECSNDSEGGKSILRMFERMTEAKGILINTFESLEPSAVRALRDGLCVPNNATPPVYCIGPLVSGGGGGEQAEHECLRWLDEQPDQSVVFLAFGSMGSFPKNQLEEIAIGLEKSGHRFLWVVRSPKSDDHKFGDPLPEPDLDALLPGGFLERTKDRGLVVKSWAPQVDVLQHRATGAFVTHCGWNSTLEGVTAGLPLLCWPLYAEQRLNKEFIVEEMKLGVEMRGYDGELVTAEEVETKVRWVMESEGGKMLRERVAAAKHAGAEALNEGGSSHAAFVQFLKDLDNESRTIIHKSASAEARHKRPTIKVALRSNFPSTSQDSTRAKPQLLCFSVLLAVVDRLPTDYMHNGGAMKQTVVLYPPDGVGHLGPMTQLAKVFLEHGYDVAMVLLEPPVKGTDSNTSFIESIVASNPSISFHVLPKIPPPNFATSTKHPFLLKLDMMIQYNEYLESFLRTIPRERLHSLVVDMFCVHAIDVATKLNLPVYSFFTSGAGVLAVLTQLMTLLSSRQTGLKELGDTPLEFLGAPPMPASHLIKELLEHPENEVCKAMMTIWKRNTETHGILINTFESLESRAVEAFRDPLCVPGRVLPQIYCIGPLVDKVAPNQVKAERHECLEWLDAQPERSVVFLSWGSKGALSKEQLKEIAVGLEKSRQRFLWIVRAPAGTDELKRFLEQRPEPDFHELLPEGFLERTKDRGLVLKSWVPQVEVLNHLAVGAFVTHCGWNSALESIMAGVPMLCWPLRSEQKMNKVFMTEDMGVAVEMAGYNTGFVKAEEVEAKVRLVIESEKGRELTKRAAGLKKEAAEALEDGGSSQASFVQFLEDVKKIVN
ncbi:hypothetical protein EJB05_17739, partial [Eragrostis curvula]